MVNYVRVSLLDRPTVHAADERHAAIIEGRAISPLKTACGRVLRGEIVSRGPRLGCAACAREVYGRRVNLAELAEHCLYDGPL